jgi:predicted membrane channel-forming protein YqfA (hemolysin III family)
MDIIVPMLFQVLAIITFLIALIMEVFNTGDEAYDNAVMIIFILSIVFFFITGGLFHYIGLTEDEIIQAPAWLNYCLAFLALALSILKATSILENQGD